MSHEQIAFETGTWGENISWELVVSENMPPIELVTGVFCVAIASDRKIVLARPKRGWGLLGGHIEDGETVEDALIRECVEEGGFTPVHPRLFAYRRLVANRPEPHQIPSRRYPHPVSYLAYYWATTDRPATEPSGLEIIESASFDIEEVQALNTPDYSLVEMGYRLCLKSLE